MEKEIQEAKIELENWLSDPDELGRKPARIEYTNHFKDEDGIECIIFKFKKSIVGKWLLGIVSESGTFSEMKEYHAKNEKEYRKAYEKAKKEKLGLWGEKNPQNPREFRLKNKRKG